MAYDKNTWYSGDVVTSAKLNNIENGIANANGAIEVTESDGVYTLHVTWNGLVSMIGNGAYPFIAIPIENEGVLTYFFGTVETMTDLGSGAETRYHVAMGGIDFGAKTATETFTGEM